MTKLKKIFESALEQTYEDFKGSFLYDNELKRDKLIQKAHKKLKKSYIPISENDIVIRIIYHLLNNKGLSKYHIFSEYKLIGNNIEDIIIQKKKKVKLRLYENYKPKTSDNQLKTPVDIVAEVKYHWKAERRSTITSIKEEKKRLDKIKKKRISKETYLVFFTYSKNDLKDLEEKYKGFNLKIYPLNPIVILNRNK